MTSGDATRPVCILARGRDASLTCEILGGAGIACESIGPPGDQGLHDLDRLQLLVIAEELLVPPFLDALRGRLAAQPPWSDIPIVVVARRGGETGRAMNAAEDLGNVSVLERPLKIDELITAVRSGLRARGRQFEVRDLLHDREEANRRKDEFLAMLAHELRNPLAPIRGVAGLMRMLDLTDPELVEAREILERQVKHMARLVDDLLDVSRITRGIVELEPHRIDLVALARDAARASAPAIEARGVRLVGRLPEGPMPAKADPIRLEQVISNLLSNAAKFTDPGGVILLAVEHDPPHVVIRVEDDGVGIDPDVLPRIYDLFTQADRTLDRSRGGIGVGLTIVKQLVELHGGSVDVRSEGLGKGTRVLVRLPGGDDAGTVAEIPVDGDRRERLARPGAAQALKVLLVEDNRDAAVVLARSLRREGHDLRVAHDGMEALASAREFRPQVVISDIGLPGMDGYQLANELRRDSLFGDLILIAVSGYGGGEIADLCRRSGFDHHLVKPLELSTLVSLLREVAEAGRTDYRGTSWCVAGHRP